MWFFLAGAGRFVGIWFGLFFLCFFFCGGFLFVDLFAFGFFGGFVWLVFFVEMFCIFRFFWFCFFLIADSPIQLL